MSSWCWKSNSILNDVELFRVIAMQVINMITQDLYLSDRSQQRFMVFDEAWKYLGAGDADERQHDQGRLPPRAQVRRRHRHRHAVAAGPARVR